MKIIIITIIAAWVSVESSPTANTISHNGKNVISVESETWTDTNQAFL